MRKIYIFIFFLFSLNLSATVYDYIKTNFSLPFINKNLEKMNVRINGNRMDISLFEAEKSSDEILKNLYNKAEENKSTFYSNETILQIAKLLYEIAGKKKYDDEFGYILYTDKNNKMNFYITSGDGSKSEVIKISTNIKENKKNMGFDDGINHFNAIEKVFSIEILSDSNRTQHFSNFYRIIAGDIYEIRNYYNSVFKRQGYRIINKYFEKGMDFFIIEKKNKNYLFTIAETAGEQWMVVMG